MTWRAEKIGRFLCLPPADRLVIIDYWVTRLLVDLMVCCFPYRWWRGMLIRPLQLTPGRETHPGLARLLRLFEIAARHYPLPANCLRDSLTIHLALRRRDIHCRLIIGVSGARQSFRAHAWTQPGADCVERVSLGALEFHALRKPHMERPALPPTD